LTFPPVPNCEEFLLGEEKAVWAHGFLAPRQSVWTLLERIHKCRDAPRQLFWLVYRTEVPAAFDYSEAAARNVGKDVAFVSVD
jgi:hypothetical protein